MIVFATFFIYGNNVKPQIVSEMEASLENELRHSKGIRHEIMDRGANNELAFSHYFE